MAAGTASTIEGENHALNVAEGKYAPTKGGVPHAKSAVAARYACTISAKQCARYVEEPTCVSTAGNVLTAKNVVGVSYVGMGRIGPIAKNAGDPESVSMEGGYLVASYVEEARYANTNGKDTGVKTATAQVIANTAGDGQRVENVKGPSSASMAKEGRCVKRV